MGGIASLRYAALAGHLTGSRAFSEGCCDARRGGRAVASVLALWVTLSAASGWAAEIDLRPSNSRAARKAAIEALPFDQLSADGQAKVRAVVDNLSLFRRMPTQQIEADPDLYLYLTNHPEVLANVWQLLGIDDVTLYPEGNGRYRAADGVGTTGFVEFLQQTAERHVIYAEGTYDGPIFAKPVQGACVLHLVSQYEPRDDGSCRVTSRLEAFIRLDHAGAEFLAKTFQPLVARVADASFVQTAGFVESLSRACEATPQGMHRLGARLTQVPDGVRAEFVEMTALVAQRAAERLAVHLEATRPGARYTARGQSR